MIATVAEEQIPLTIVDLNTKALKPCIEKI